MVNMAHVSTYETKFRRRREEKTNYKKRLALLKSGKARFVVRKSLKQITAQVMQYEKNGDKIVAGAKSNDLSKFGWPFHKGNLSSAYLTGYLCAVRALAKKQNNAVLDIGLATPIHGSAVFAALKGALDAGIEIAHDATSLPSEDRIRGKHIVEYASKLSPEEFGKRFSAYAKANVDVKKIGEYFENTVKEIKNTQGGLNA